MKTHALILEDDRVLNDGIKEILKGIDIDGFQAKTVDNAKKIMETNEIDLIILDINLPDGNGLDFCMYCKKNYKSSIIIISALDMDIDVVRGLELGADDYITKPFSMIVLRARIHAALRKYYRQETIKIDDMEFDFSNMVYKKAGTKIQLSITEQKVLKLLVENRGNIIPVDTFLHKVWDSREEYVDKHALTVTIKRLREKLEDTPGEPRYIKNIYGIGYMWKNEKI